MNSRSNVFLDILSIFKYLMFNFFYINFDRSYYVKDFKNMKN
jgi:hypothetical protein